MLLTKNQKINLIGFFGAAILSALLLIIIREYYSPDIRYEKGSFYILGNSGITFLKLINYGHSDAEDIRINIVFNKSINDFSLNDKLISLKNISGGKDSQSYSGEIDRLVPSQEAFIYFSTELNSFLPHESASISSISITYKGGIAETGVPILSIQNIAALLGIIPLIIATVILFFYSEKVRTRFKRKERDLIFNTI
jgi:hypothetical protein